MKIDVRITYYADVCVRPKLKAEEMTFDATLTVDVAEATGNEAPVALRYKSWPSDEAVPLRWHDGRLWAPRTFSEGRDAPEVQQRASELVAACGEPNGYGGMRIAVRDTYGESRGDLAAMPNVRRVERNDLEERAARVRAEADGLLVVDGTVWSAVEEPALSISRPGIFSDDRQAFVSVETSPASKVARSLYRLDEADALVARLGEGWDRDMPHFEVLIPEALKGRFAERELVEWAESHVNSMGERLKDADRAYFDAYAALRDALPSAREALAGEDPASGLERLAELAETASCADHERRRSRDAYYEDRGPELVAVRRFRDRTGVDDVAALTM